MDQNAYVAIGLGVAAALAALMYALTQMGIFGILVVLILLGGGGYYVYASGLLSSSSSSASPTVLPASPTTPTLSALGPKPETYYVSNNKFTFEEAPAVCAANGGRLATYDDVESAYSNGAEWCGYGWTDGGFALYPIQKSSWASKFSKDPKHSCGRPGINGGYFDPTMKFGVNCVGVKPPMTDAERVALQKGIETPDDKRFDSMVQRIKDEMGNIRLAPFTEGEWSQWASVAPSPSAPQAVASTSVSAVAGPLQNAARMWASKVQAAVSSLKS
jgi:hypothetical protein